MLTRFAAFALILASLGIYAVISYSVNQRVQEIGIRMALGASAAELQGQVMLRTLGLAALGLALGMVGARLPLLLDIFQPGERRESIQWWHCE